MSRGQDSRKFEAMRLRKRGISTRTIESRLGIARSTLHYWFKDVKISDYHKEILARKAKHSLVIARKEAVKWHNAEKEKRMRKAHVEAESVVSKLKDQDTVDELALALLYLGEGMKKSNSTAMGNSDPMILKFFVGALEHLYMVPRNDMHCEIHIRADQEPAEITRFWSETLNIPIENFGKPSIDKRTVGRPTYSHYKGVCVVRCSRVAIQRKLVYIASMFCAQSAERWAVSSVGRAQH